jgi:hypothetical protein
MNYDIWVTPVPYAGVGSVEGPTPEEAGLSETQMYLVLNVHDNGEMNSEAYFSVINDAGQVWFVSNRHFVVREITKDGIPMLSQRGISQETRYEGWSGFDE